MKTRIDDFDGLDIEHKKGSGFVLSIDPTELFLSYEAAKKLVDYVRATWKEMDEEMLKIICGEKHG